MQTASNSFFCLSFEQRALRMSVYVYGLVCAAAQRGLLRTESMPDRELTSPRGSRGRARTVADLLKPGASGVAKTLGSPRNMRASLVSPSLFWE